MRTATGPIDPDASDAAKLDLLLHQSLFQVEALFFAISHLVDGLHQRHAAQERHVDYLTAIDHLGSLGSTLSRSLYEPFDHLQELIRSEYDLEVK